MARNSLSKFSRELPKEPSCEIISKSDYRFGRRSHLKLFSFYGLGPFCSTEHNHLIYFGRGLAKEHFCEFISKSVHRFSRGSCLKFFLFIALVAILFNRAERFEQFW